MHSINQPGYAFQKLCRSSHAFCIYREMVILSPLEHQYYDMRRFIRPLSPTFPPLFFSHMLPLCRGRMGSLPGRIIKLVRYRLCSIEGIVAPNVHPNPDFMAMQSRNSPPNHSVFDHPIINILLSASLSLPCHYILR